MNKKKKNRERTTANVLEEEKVVRGDVEFNNADYPRSLREAAGHRENVYM